MGSILLVRDEKTFMVNAMISNMKEAGHAVEEVSFSAKKLDDAGKRSDIIVIYADDTLAENQEVMLLLKDLSIDYDKRLVFIGSKQENEDVEQVIPKHLFAEMFERPLDMNKFIDRINAMFEDKKERERKKCILLCDDDVSFLHIMNEWLKDDYIVGMAKSGMQAITWIARNNVDLILLDYEMPTVDGLKVFEMLKSEQFSKDIPVMFLTGKSDKLAILRAMSMKPAGYILKDISKQQLMGKLDDFFSKNDSREQSK